MLRFHMLGVLALVLALAERVPAQDTTGTTLGPEQVRRTEDTSVVGPILAKKSVVRLRLATGALVYGCVAQHDVTGVRLKLLEPGFVEADTACNHAAEGPTRFDNRNIQRMELRQRYQQRGPGAAWGALIGSLVGGGAYWTLPRHKRCDMCLLNTPLDWIGAGSLLGAATGALIGVSVPDHRWATVWPSVVTDTPHRGFTARLLDLVKIEGTAAAGFAGLRIAEAIVTERDDTSYVARPNYRYAWRPAVSTGMVTYFYTPSRSQFGAGLGFQMVMLPLGEGNTQPYPGISLHLGTPQTEFFVGMVLSPTDSIALSKDGQRVSSAVQLESLVIPNFRRSRHLYAGIQIKGTRKGAEDLGIPERASIRLVTDTIAANDPVRLVAYVADTLGRVVQVPVIDWSVLTGNATVRNGELQRHDGSDIVVVEARYGNLREYFRIRRKAQEPVQDAPGTATPQPQEGVTEPGPPQQGGNTPQPHS